MEPKKVYSGSHITHFLTKMIKSRCASCRLCLYPEKKPNSIVSRIWRWHTSWCPLEKAYEKKIIQTKHNFVQKSHNWHSKQKNHLLLFNSTSTQLLSKTVVKAIFQLYAKKFISEKYLIQKPGKHSKECHSNFTDNYIKNV